MNMLFWSVGGVVLLWFLVKRLIRQMGTFEEYKARHDKQYMQTIEAMHKESARLSADEAMVPVIAGMREMFEPHVGGCVHVRQTPEGPLAVLRLPTVVPAFESDSEPAIEPQSEPGTGSSSESGMEIEVVWVLRRVRLNSGWMRDMRHGHFEARMKGGQTRNFEELADLMLFLRQFDPALGNPFFF